MHTARLFFIASSITALAGCNTTHPSAVVSAASPSAAQLRAQFNALTAQYANDCLNGSIAQISANKALCAAEQKRIDPVGIALQAADEAEAVRRAQHP